MSANNLEAMTRHFAERWSKVTADKELEQYLSDGIAQLEDEHRKQVEALQAENEALRAKTSMSIGVGDGTGNLFVHGDYDSIKKVQEMIFEYENLRTQLNALVEGIELLLSRLEKMPRKLWIKEQLGAVLAELSTTNKGTR